MLKVLQQGLLTKIPFCPYARLGGMIGERLARAAFAVLTKFSQNMESFMHLSVKLLNVPDVAELEGD